MHSLNLASQVQELLIQGNDDIVTFVVVDAVDETKAVHIHGVLSRDKRVLILASCINQFQTVFLPLDFYILGQNCENKNFRQASA